MTVDRAHVLATPGMDSHGAYVALSRHRDGVDLHYGRDDFADQSKLVRTLSRERGKDMASDYKPEQQFAERRGITFRERIVEIARQLPERAKSIFAGFRPQTQKLEPLPTEQAGQSNQRRAVERFARAAADIGQMREQGLPILPHQREALEKAGKALDAIRPHAAADLASALQRQPSLAREAADGRSQGAIRAMQLEAEIRIDPAKRADRFVSDWQRLGQARAAMQQDGDTDMRASACPGGWPTWRKVWSAILRWNCCCATARVNSVSARISHAICLASLPPLCRSSGPARLE